MAGRANTEARGKARAALRAALSLALALTMTPAIALADIAPGGVLSRG